MKKIILLVVLVFVVNQYTNAQNVFGIKVGINYNSDSFQDVKDNIIEENVYRNRSRYIICKNYFD